MQDISINPGCKVTSIFDITKLNLTKVKLLLNLIFEIIIMKILYKKTIWSLFNSDIILNMISGDFPEAKFI